MLFNWYPMSEDTTVAPGDRAAWANKPTSFDWKAMSASYRPTGPNDKGPGWGQVAGYSLSVIDQVVGNLGNPIGIASYKPYQSSGEDFLQNYLGNIGLPIEMTPDFPSGADTILLTQSASFDPDIVAKMKSALAAGHKIVITSGFLRAMQGRGIEDVVEWQDTGRVAAVHDFINGYGAGNGGSLNDSAHDNPPVLFPEIRFWTNDSWPIIRGAASAKGFPIVLMNRYSKGVVYLLAIPENIGDLYNLPRGVITQVKRYLQQDFPVRIESSSRVALFAYDNDTFVVESYLPTETDVRIVVAGVGKQLRNLLSGTTLTALPPPSVPAQPRFYSAPVLASAESAFDVEIQPHSFAAFRIEPAGPVASSSPRHVR